MISLDIAMKILLQRYFFSFSPRKTFHDPFTVQQKIIISRRFRTFLAPRGKVSPRWRNNVRSSTENPVAKTLCHRPKQSHSYVQRSAPCPYRRTKYYNRYRSWQQTESETKRDLSDHRSVGSPGSTGVTGNRKRGY